MSVFYGYMYILNGMMEECHQFVADNASENGASDSSDTDSNQICDKPIDLIQTHKCNKLNSTNDSMLSKLVKSKTFSIKDILGLEESDKKIERVKLTKDERIGGDRRLLNESELISPSAMINSSR